MERSELVERLRQRQADLRGRLEDALQRAWTSKAQYEELDQLLSIDGLGDVAGRVQQLRQAKLAENASAIEEVQSILARLQVHDELMAVLGEGTDDGAERA